MAELRHPAASHELPSFITAPGETDVLMVVMSLFLAAGGRDVRHPVLAAAHSARANGA